MHKCIKFSVNIKHRFTCSTVYDNIVYFMFEWNSMHIININTMCDHTILCVVSYIMRRGDGCKTSFGDKTSISFFQILYRSIRYEGDAI